jgi:hypothetical protein
MLVKTGKVHVKLNRRRSFYASRRFLFAVLSGAVYSSGDKCGYGSAQNQRGGGRDGLEYLD